MNTPTKRVTTIVRHEWVAYRPSGETKITARDFDDAMHCARKEMKQLGVDTKFDDSYFVFADGDDVVIGVEIATTE